MTAETARVTLLTLCVVLTSTVLAACRAGDEDRMPAHASAPILLFNGAGASSGDVVALRTILLREHLEYSTADSQQLNRMTESQIREYRLLIVPGGNFMKIGNGLTVNTTAIHNGLNYLGI
jgi:hypothetical protein